MSTNGIVGIVVNGQEKIAYNHDDSNPGGIGIDILKFLREVDREKLQHDATNLQVVADYTQPTPEQVQALLKYADPNVGYPGDQWYRLLRHTQGDLSAILEAG